MSGWGFESVRSACGGRWLVGPAPGAASPSGASIDTRSLERGQVFFALRGERVDGHDYLDAAHAQGASIAVVDDAHAGQVAARAEARGSEALPLLLIDDVRTALGKIARAYHDACAHLRVIGVTGSCGKTTTVRLIDAALGAGLRGSASVKSFNNDLGVPLTLLNAGADDDYVVCEMGSSSPGEIAHLCEIARPDVGIITSIGRAHLEGFGSLAGVAKEKAALLAGVLGDGLRVAPAGSAELDAVLNRLGVHAVRVGADAAHLPNHLVERIESDADGVRFVLGGERFHVPIPGAHNAYNGACAVLVARWFGLEGDMIRRGLASARAPEMRMEVRRHALPGGEITVINDAYNANPESMAAGLATLAAWPGATRRIAVLGDMLEQGAHSEQVHDELVRGVRTNRSFDLVVFVGAAMCAAWRGADEGEEGVDTGGKPVPRGGGGVGVYCFESLDGDAPDRIAGLIEPGDVVLLKGSRGAGIERVAAAIDRRGAGG